MNWAGRGLAVAGAALILVSIWVKTYDEGFKISDDGTYAVYYLAMLVLVVGFIAVAALTRRRIFSFVAMVLALVACGDSVDTVVFNAFGAYDGTSIGYWLLPIGGLILAAGAVLDYLAHDRGVRDRDAGDLVAAR